MLLIATWQFHAILMRNEFQKRKRECSPNAAVAAWSTQGRGGRCFSNGENGETWKINALKASFKVFDFRQRKSKMYFTLTIEHFEYAINIMRLELFTRYKVEWFFYSINLEKRKRHFIFLFRQINFK